MAKRSRGSRPGQRGRIIRHGTRPLPPPSPSLTASPSGLTVAEEARAAALESQIVAEERAAEARSRSARRAADVDTTVRSRGRESGMLAVRTADELLVVRRDLRHIFMIDGGLIGVLIGLWILGSATGFIRF